MLQFTPMSKVLYCTDKLPKKKAFFPFSFDVASKIKDIHQNNYSIIILNEGFLRRKKNLKPLFLKDKICFIHFPKKDKNNLKIVKRYGFFDCLTDEDNKLDIAFKVKRLGSFLKLRTKVKKLKSCILDRDKKIEKISLIDPSIDCYNWRYFLQRTQEELNRARRYLYSVSFVAIDIDNFRQLNEIYGVKLADSVIKKLVDILRGSLRKEDVFCRWREDDFFVILPHSKNRGAQELALRIKDRISLNKIKYKKLSLSIKASIGVVSFPEDNIFNVRDVVAALNRCLIQAKRKGGNAVLSYSTPQHSSLHGKKADADELRGKIEKMNVLLARDLMEMIYAFARTIEAKDSYTGKHVECTATIAQKIAKNLNLSKDEVENIKHGAVLHDLGKIGIGEGILTKKGPLNVKERGIIKTHPSIAAEILHEIHALRGAIPCILYHHERFDGKGYPLELKGDQIPLGARIIAVADVYQALISDRPYRKAYSIKKAVEIIKNEVGKYFDPKIVKIFLEVIDEINVKI